MRKLLTFLACAAVWLLCAPLCRAQPALTTIQDTLYNLDGSLMNGSLIVTTPAFSVAGVPIAHGTHTFAITNGVVNIQLAPTDHANPTVTYTVDTVSNGLGAASVWSVPTLPSAQCASSSHCTIPEVTVASGLGPTLLLNPSQISTGASQPGQSLCNVSGIVGWCDESGGIWGSITGTLSAQTDLENALNAKQSALGFTPENVANKDAASGYAGLDSGGKLKTTECPTASSSQAGCLQSTDWSTFNGKQNALGFTPENAANKDQNNGYAGLDANGKYELTRMPAKLTYYCNSTASDGANYTCTTGLGLTALNDGDQVLWWVGGSNCVGGTFVVNLSMDSIGQVYIWQNTFQAVSTTACKINSAVTLTYSAASSMFFINNYPNPAGAAASYWTPFGWAETGTVSVPSTPGTIVAFGPFTLPYFFSFQNAMFNVTTADSGQYIALAFMDSSFNVISTSSSEPLSPAGAHGSGIPRNMNPGSYWLLMSSTSSGVAALSAGESATMQNLIASGAGSLGTMTCTNTVTWSTGTPTWPATCGTGHKTSAYNAPLVFLGQ